MEKLISYLIRGCIYFNLNAQTESPILNEQKTLICIFLRWKNFRKKTLSKSTVCIVLGISCCLVKCDSRKKVFLHNLRAKGLKRGVGPNRLCHLEGGASNLRLINGCFMTISSQIFAIYIHIFHKTRCRRSF